MATATRSLALPTTTLRPFAAADETDQFATSRANFDELVEHLHSPSVCAMQHGELEEFLGQQGRELIKLLFQDHLRLRAHQEVRRDAVEGADGVVRTHVRQRQRGLVTIFGPVQVQRLAYGAGECSSVFPMDAQLNLPRESYSAGLRRLGAEEVARGSFDEAVKGVQRATGIAMPKRQLEQLAWRAAEDFEEFYQARQATCAEETKDLLVMSLDGKGVIMRRQDLTEQTRRKAERRDAKGPRACNKDSRAGRKRMATVAAVYTVARYPRTPTDVIREYRREEDDSPHKQAPRPPVRNKRVWASVENPAEQVTEEVFQEALRRDPKRKRQWAVLVDGDEHQLSRIDEACQWHEMADLTIILDFVHVLGYLWKAAHAFHKRASDEAYAWVRERALRILEGASSSVAAGMRRSATRRELCSRRRKAVDTCANYLLKYGYMLRYDEYLRKGMPIASGVIEGACRHLIKDRMDITGARWSVDGAEAVLRLRALRSSGDFEVYWRFHQERELERNHPSESAVSPLKRVG